ncbi:phosphoribosylglycinamide formyltransferase [Longirhabdus pacifica]|uniref:phosphoribosylglycinamide formyltransferase n=1 Tax=Longirhabdus pacifica TaxID=2305227 RepID=UPI0010089703|nr:phosphoribosylglycinamide formyltransferase [Longirhabdus pacifica]
MSTFRIAVFASGDGSNFQAIVDQVHAGTLDVHIELLICDNKTAKVIQKAEEAGIDVFVFDPKAYESKQQYEAHIVEELKERNVALLVLAGYMRLLSSTLLTPYQGRVINIHPSLLPAFPGKNGLQDAMEYGVKVTGCTVHFVDDGMDSGPVIAQRVMDIKEEDTLALLSQKMKQLEHQLYPEVIQQCREGRIILKDRRVIVAKDIGGN